MTDSHDSKDTPWRVSTGWIRSASGSKIVEIGGHSGVTVEDAVTIVTAVNAQYGTDSSKEET